MSDSVLNQPPMFAYVLYGDNQKEIISVRNIKRYKPTSLYDFDSVTPMSVKTNAWSKDKTYEYFKGVVQGLGINKAGVEASRKAFLRNKTEREKDRISYIISTLNPNPLLTSDAGDDKDDAAAEQQRESKREALTDANEHIGGAVLDHLIKRQNRKRTDTGNNPKKPQKTGQVSSKKRSSEDEEIKRAHSKKRKEQAQHKENAEFARGQELSAASSALAATRHSKPALTKSLPVQRLNSTTPPTLLSKMEMLTPHSNSRPSSSSVSSSSIHLSASKALPRISSPTILHECPTADMKWKQEMQDFMAYCKQENKSTKETLLDIGVQLTEIRNLMATLLQDRVNLQQLTVQGTSKEVCTKQQTSSIIAYGLVVSGGKVHLGADFSCEENAWITMNTCDTESEWLTAILCGTFGEEKAMLYRVCPRYTDLLYFPKSFLTTAAKYYDSFIKRRREEMTPLFEQNKEDPEFIKQAEFFFNDDSLMKSKLRSRLADKATILHNSWMTRQAALGVTMPVRTLRPKSNKKSGVGPRKKQPEKKKVTLPFQGAKVSSTSVSSPSGTPNPTQVEDMETSGIPLRELSAERTAELSQVVQDQPEPAATERCDDFSDWHRTHSYNASESESGGELESGAETDDDHLSARSSGFASSTPKSEASPSMGTIQEPLRPKPFIVGGDDIAATEDSNEPFVNAVLTPL